MTPAQERCVSVRLPESLLFEIDAWAGPEYREVFIANTLYEVLWDAKQRGLAPAVVDYLEEAGTDMLEAEDYAAARIIFQRITHVKPDYAEAWVFLGNIEYRCERYAMAGRLHRKAEKLAKADLERQFGSLANVRLWWSEIDTRPYMRARYNLGLVLWKQGKRDEALQIFQDLVRLDRQDHLGARFLVKELTGATRSTPKDGSTHRTAKCGDSTPQP